MGMRKMADEIQPTEIEAPISSDAPSSSENISADTSIETKPRNWRGKLVFITAIGSVLAGLIGPVGAGIGAWGYSLGLSILSYSFFGALIAIVMGVFGFVGRKKAIKPPRLLLITGMAIATAYAGWLLNYAIIGRSVPAIHDISTDLADPPEFKSLAIRADNFDQIPGAEDSAMRGMTPQQRWETLHRGSYGDIRSVRINQPVAAVIEKANRLAKARGWEVALVSPAEGRLEATETSRLFRFKDDVVLRVRPTENGAGSIVDMRSISRVGKSDIGVNAKRVKSFLADLSGTVTAG
jgi:uncharacterized protein (DUF1499 family)